MEKEANARKKHLLWFNEVGINDVAFVGGKNAALGEMYSNLAPLGVQVPNGFALTADAYRYFLKEGGLAESLKKALSGMNVKNIRDLQTHGKKARSVILSAELPAQLKKEIAEAYKKLCKEYGENTDVAVRSSATAEDLPDASFAGQQETYLDIRGADAVCEAVKKCIASLFTDRAISYREDKGFSHTDVALSVGVQKMVRSDLGSSGVAFTIDTETGFDKVIIINGSFGLGEMVVQGQVIPDEFLVFKPLLGRAPNPIISRTLGKKTEKLIYGPRNTKRVAIPLSEQRKWCLSDKEAIELAEWCVVIEEHFSKKSGHYQPMDIEWAKDGKTNKLFIVQARPETVHAAENKQVIVEYFLCEKPKEAPLATGIAVGTKIGSGAARVIKSATRISEFKKDEVLVTEITDPDWEPIMKIASAIVTDKGGRTSHAAIVSRELGIPCIVGVGNATKKIKTGEAITVDCSSGTEGKIYKGELKFEQKKHSLKMIPQTRTKIMVNIGAPGEAFSHAHLPVKGVGLGRLEFIIVSQIKIHPNALLEFSTISREAKKDKKTRTLVDKIEKETVGYENKELFYVDKLAEGIAKISAAFFPNNVIIRFSDFKTNEYRTLIGGERYEPQEENPMLGWRGASRYYDPKFRDAFVLECRAIKKAREEMGLLNIIPMIPFCRTPEEGKKTLEIMEKAGLESVWSRRRAKKDIEGAILVYVMCEIPSNILRADEFLEYFDGMSIGSNDLTQLTLGLDRDSGIVSGVGNEKDPSVKKLISAIIRMCRKRDKYIGICGQAPSDYPDFAAFLVKEGIESISLNPDTVIKTILAVAEEEKKLVVKQQPTVS